jgi:hypothetical protein
VGIGFRPQMIVSDKIQDASNASNAIAAVGKRVDFDGLALSKIS